MALSSSTTQVSSPKARPKLLAGESPGTYQLSEAVTEAQLLHLAKMLARRRLRRGRCLGQPEEVYRCLQTLLLDYPYEVFGVLLLDQRHRVITFQELFRGTLDAASVFPREVVQHALQHHAAAVIMVHNHPSGHPEPSEADRRITRRVKDALALMDIRTLDHVVVGHEGYASFAEKGWI